MIQELDIAIAEIAEREKQRLLNYALLLNGLDKKPIQRTPLSLFNETDNTDSVNEWISELRWGRFGNNNYRGFE